MQKRCKCGHFMILHLSMVVYSKSIKIENVPVYSCEQCQKSKLYHGIKNDVLELIGVLEGLSGDQHIYFDEHNEFARFMAYVQEDGEDPAKLDESLEEWIDQLLDLLLIAKALQDESWQEDIHKRLTQISSYMVYSA